MQVFWLGLNGDFMALTFLQLFPPQFLPPTSGMIYVVPTIPTSSLLRNGRIRLTNTTASAVVATLYAVPNGGSPSAVNEFFGGESVSGNSHVDIDVPQLMFGDSIWGVAASSNAINITAIDGVLIS